MDIFKKIQKKPLTKACIGSLLLHSLFFLSILIFKAKLPQQPLHSESTLRVDVVALPDRIPIEIQKKIEKKEKLNTKVKEGILMKEIESEKRSEKNRKALKKIQSLAQFQGNKISLGNQISGEQKEVVSSQYLDLLREVLQKNWILPPWTQSTHLSAQVQLHIDAYGKIQKINFIQLSGDHHFDHAVKKTLEISQPFPPPPSDMAHSALTRGILIGFPL